MIGKTAMFVDTMVNDVYESRPLEKIRFIFRPAFPKTIAAKQLRTMPGRGKAAVGPHSGHKAESGRTTVDGLPSHAARCTLS